MDEQTQMEASAGERLALIADSYTRLTGATLVADGASLWDAPRPILAHAGGDNPRFFYANRLALGLFKMTPAQFAGFESRLSAAPENRAERAAMFTRLESANVVTGYRGVRVASDGSEFVITDATIWNLIGPNDEHHGQAAVFAAWEVLG